MEEVNCTEVCKGEFMDCNNCRHINKTIIEEKSIYPLILMDYYPLRIDMNEDNNSIFMCRDIQEIEKVIIAYNKEMGNLVRNIKLIPNNRVIEFQVADSYYDKPEESDWYDKTIDFETLRIFKE